jgi:hypothetical protein
VGFDFTIDSRFPQFVMGEAVIYGICVAPWLTLLTRSALCGTLVTAGLPALLQLIMLQPEDISSYALQLAGASSAFIPLIGLPLSWLEFRKCGEPRALPGFDVRASLDPENRKVLTSPKLWQLFKKELQLQRLGVALGLLCLAINFFLDRKSVGLWTILYPSVLALLIGATASADERQFGTWQWQMLLPSSRSIQWAIKVATVLILSSFLSGVLPLEVLRKVGRSQDVPPGAMGFMVFNAVFLSMVGLYASSLCSSGLKAMLLSIFPAVAVIATEIKVASWVVPWMFERYFRFQILLGFPLLVMLSAGVVLFLLLRFAQENHCNGVHQKGRVIQQILHFLVIFAVFHSVVGPKIQ